MEHESPVKHGGNILALAEAHGIPLAEIYDFSASINPLGTPLEVVEALEEALPEICHYPEQHAGRLVAALSDYHGVPEEQLLAGNGSTELIYLLPRVLRPKRAAVVAPAFGEYARALELAGVPVDVLCLDPEDQFRFDPVSLCERLDPACELVVVANPGNPHGGPIDSEDLLTFAQRLPAGVQLLVDEAFVDFCPDYSVLEAVSAFDNLIVLRSLTKFYAIPGLRAGYLAGPNEVVERLRDSQEPWSVGAPAQHAARACLEAHAYRRATWRQIPRLRQQLAVGLEKLGLQVFDSSANYLLGRLPQSTSGEVLASLLQLQGILIRSCSDFAGLDDRYLRFAVRSADENRMLLRALGALVSESAGERPS